MSARTNPFVAAPQLMQQLIDYGATLLVDGLEPSLIKLVGLRACQINGSASGLQRYVTEARNLGESNARIDLLAAWRDTPLYSERERAALAWTEALTRVADTRAPDEDYAAVRAQFTETEEVRLTLLICAFNTFNRVAVGHRLPPQVEAERQAA
ncbi:MAG: carboxymuconolactone decarboxylase family protein [Caulobacterales bacterium]|nr:carboxymuconolactone decarboxylase family protein [Caulobacterales bacterium]